MQLIAADAGVIFHYYIWSLYIWSLAPGQVWAWFVLGLWAIAYRRSLETTLDA